MTIPPPLDSSEEFERALLDGPKEVYELQLYVTGTSPRSQRAILNLRAICDQFLRGRFKLQVIDIYQQPELAQSAQVLAVPMLIKSKPFPVCRLIGDLSDRARVLAVLSLLTPG